MMIVNLSDETGRHLHRAAALRGLDTDTYAEELLAISLAAMNSVTVGHQKRLYNVMEFSGIAPTGRTSAEIDAEIAAGRAEWDEKKNPLGKLESSLL